MSIQTIADLVQRYHHQFQACLFRPNSQSQNEHSEINSGPNFIKVLKSSYSPNLKQELIKSYDFSESLAQRVSDWIRHLTINRATKESELGDMIEQFLKQNSSQLANYIRIGEARVQTDRKTKSSRPISCCLEVQSLGAWIRRNLLDSVKGKNSKEVEVLQVQFLQKFKMSKKTKYALVMLGESEIEELSIRAKQTIVKDFSRVLRTFSVKFLISFSKTMYLQYIKQMRTPKVYRYYTVTQLDLYYSSIQQHLSKNTGFLRHWLKIKFYEQLEEFGGCSTALSIVVRNSKLTGANKKRKLIVLKEKLKLLDKIDSREILDLHIDCYLEVLHLETQTGCCDRTLLQYFKKKMDTQPEGQISFKDIYSSRQKTEQQSIVNNHLNKVMEFPNPDYYKQLKKFMKKHMFRLEDEEYILDKLRALMRLRKDGNVAEAQQFLTAQQIESFKEQTSVIVNDQSAFYGVSDSVTIKAKIKNVLELSVRIYEINLMQFYISNPNQQLKDIDLSYICPLNQYCTSIKDTDPFVESEAQILINGLEGKRGVWVIELLACQKFSRAIIFKGNLCVESRRTSRGVAFQCFFEDLESGKQSISREKQFSVWQQGVQILCDNGEYVIPYGPKKQCYDLVFFKGGCAVKQSVEIPAEEFVLDVGYLYGCETFIKGSQATIVLWPTVRLKDDESIAFESSQLEDVKIQLTLHSSQGVVSFQEYSVSFLNKISYDLVFEVEHYLEKVQISVISKIAIGSRNKCQLRSSKTIQFNNQICEQQGIMDIYLQLNEKGLYEILVLGANGEEYPKMQLELTLQFWDRFQNQTSILRTDKEGKISLGTLESVEVLSARFHGRRKAVRTWKMGNIFEYPQHNVYLEGESVVVPIFRTKNIQQVFLTKITRQGDCLEDRSTHLPTHIEGGALRIDFLPHGYYELYFIACDKVMRFRVIESRQVIKSQEKNFTVIDLKGREMTSVPSKRNGIIGEVSLSQEGQLLIILQGSTGIEPESAMYVMGSTFIPPYFDSKLYNGGWNQILPALSKNLPNNCSCFSNVQSQMEESQYVQNRQKTQTKIGVNLALPRILLKPNILDQAIQKIQTHQNKLNNQPYFQDKLKFAREEPPKQLQSQTYAKLQSQISLHNNFLKSSNFFAKAAVSVGNQKGSKIKFKCKVPKECTHFIILYITKQSWVSQTCAFPKKTNFSFKSLQHKDQTGREDGKALVLRRETQRIQVGQQLKLSIAKKVKFTIVQTPQIAKFMRAKGVVVPNWVENWHHYEREEKEKIYNQYLGHEINCFIKKHDPQFFNSLKGFLKNKINMGLVDLYLLDNPSCAEYYELTKFTKLSVFQKILLGESLLKFQQFQKAKKVLTSIILQCKQTAKYKNQIFFPQFDSFIGGVDLRDISNNEKKRAGNLIDRRLQTKCKQYGQAEYYGTGFMEASPFWADLAQHWLKHGLNGPAFLSDKFFYFKSVMEFVAGAIFLPMSGGLTTINEGHDCIRVSSEKPALLISHTIENACLDDKLDVFVRQRILKKNASKEEDCRKFKLKETYTLKTIVTNLSGRSLLLQVIISIPKGAVPLGDKEVLQIKDRMTDAGGPNMTLTFERDFYFPSKGLFKMQPASVSLDGIVVATGVSSNQVKEQPQVIEPTKNAKEFAAIVVDFNESKPQDMNNFLGDLSVLKGWEFEDILQMLRERKVFISEVWKLAYLHRNLQGIKQFEQFAYEQKRGAITDNPQIHEFSHYQPLQMEGCNKFYQKKIMENQSLLMLLRASQSKFGMSDECLMGLMYYRYLNNDRAKVQSIMKILCQPAKNQRFTMQLDYFEVNYLLSSKLQLAMSEINKIRLIADSYQACPLQEWRQLFIAAKLKVMQYEDIAQDPQVSQVSITQGDHFWQIFVPPNTCLTICYFKVNLQLWFSTQPFALPQAVLVSPLKSIEIKEPQKVQWPEPDSQGDWLVQMQIEEESKMPRQVYLQPILNSDIGVEFGNNLFKVRFKGKAAQDCYVKVYGRSGGCSGEFFSDGYTDVNGKYQPPPLLQKFDEISCLFVHSQRYKTIRNFSL